MQQSVCQKGTYNIKTICNYLKLVDSDDAKFNEYFWWKDFYRRSFHHHQTLCDVFEKLYTLYQPKTYKNMKQWWVDDTGCSSTTQISHRDVI